MAERMREYRQRTGETVALRVGIATGAVVAGVVGRRKFLYDVWGEPVALAERLAARPLEAGIHVDAVTRRRLESRFAFDDRVDTATAEGASVPLDAWRLLGRRT
jgi:adenylate cyclase